MMGCPGDGGWMGGGWMMGLPMVFGVLLLVALVAAGLWLLARAISGRAPGSSATSGSSARAILEERFARGEIDREEFEERRRTLEN